MALSTVEPAGQKKGRRGARLYDSMLSLNFEDVPGYKNVFDLNLKMAN